MDSKYVMNQSYIIEYENNEANIYILSPNNNNIHIGIGIISFSFTFETHSTISDIKFNPFIDDMVLFSFEDGTCKIYTIIENSLKERIIFEGINEKKISYSEFNYHDPNLILSINIKNNIIIWDVRKISFLNIINFEQKIMQIRWSIFSDKYIELITISKMELININNINAPIIINYDRNSEIIKDFLFFNENSLIYIKSNEIVKKEIKGQILGRIGFKNIEIINKDLLKYNIIIIFSEKALHLIDISLFNSFQVINWDYNSSDFPFFFFYDKSDITCYYLLNECASKNNKKISFKLNNEIKNKYTINKSNLNNNFYIKYEENILKYISLLNYNENIKEEQIYIKNYMKINEVKIFFDDVKKVNIFERKNIVNCILENIEPDTKDEKLKLNSFNKIIEFCNILKINDTKQRKNEIIIKINKNGFNINMIYIQIVKLLTLDNTNLKLLELYLILINLYEKMLINYYGEDNYDKYESEIKYYCPCFSKENYKILFDIEKEGEKDKLLHFLDKVNSIKKFNYSNKELIDLVNGIQNIEFSSFNQPIDFDCENDELKWFLCEFHIISYFKNLKLTKEKQDAIGRIKRCLNCVVNNELLKNEKIYKNKYKLQSTILLITNPCDINNKNPQFICNLLLGEDNKIEQLKEKYKNQINAEKKTLLLKGIEYNNIEKLCLKNLTQEFDSYEREEKYNFEYLINHFVPNQKDIKIFFKKILKKNVFKEAYNILFGNDDYKLLEQRYLDEFIDKRLIFAPIKPFSTLAVSDKISLSTIIAFLSKQIVTQFGSNLSEKIKEILNTGSYVLIEEHEIFHLLNCIPFYETNCAISINTPRKKNYTGRSEGGEYLELLLFDKIFNNISLKETLYILNEENYDKSLKNFKKDFKKLEKNDLIIKGTFNYYNNFIQDKLESTELENTYIILKSLKFQMPCSEIYLEDDIIGKK